MFTDQRESEQVARFIDLFLPSAAAAVRIAEQSKRPFDHAISVGGCHVDVHSDPSKLPVAPLHLSTAWQRTDVITTGPERSLRVLDLEMSIVVALIHALRDSSADLLHLYDFSLLFDSHPDWDFVVTYASLEGWTHLIRFAVRLICAALDRVPPIEISLPDLSLRPRRSTKPGSVASSSGETTALPSPSTDGPCPARSSLGDG